MADNLHIFISLLTRLGVVKRIFTAALLVSHVHTKYMGYKLYEDIDTYKTTAN
jgi:hypothetical protein